MQHKANLLPENYMIMQAVCTSEWHDMDSISILTFKNIFMVNLKEKGGTLACGTTGYGKTHTQTHKNVTKLSAHLIPFAGLCFTTTL